MTEHLVLTREFGHSLDDWGTSTAATGELLRAALDRTQLDLLTIHAPSHEVVRGPTHVAAASEPLHVIVVQLSGSGVLRPEDGTAAITLEPGDVGYWTSTMPYRWQFTGPTRLLIVRVPFAALDIVPGALRPLIGRTFPSASGIARYVVPFAEDVLGDPDVLAGQSGTRIVQNLVSLLTTMLVEELDLVDARNRSAPAFRRVAEYIATHLGDDLDVRTVAAENAMSTRYLQALFQDRGTTVSAWVRMRRLEATRQALADPAQHALGIGAVAAQYGFGDQAHFARLFRATFAETPSRWRARNR